MDALPYSLKQNSSEGIDLRTTYFTVLIITACVVIYYVIVTFSISFEGPVNTII